jgi:hypothetical protein
MANTCAFPVSTRSRTVLLRNVPDGAFFVVSDPVDGVTLTEDLHLQDAKGTRWDSLENWFYGKMRILGKEDPRLEEELLFRNEIKEGFRLFDYYTIVSLACNAHGLTRDSWIRLSADYMIHGYHWAAPASVTSYGEKVVLFAADPKNKIRPPMPLGEMLDDSYYV